MKFIFNKPLFIAAFFIPLALKSATISIRNLCENSPYKEAYIYNEKEISVGELTHDFFGANRNIQHSITSNSVISIFETPTGLDSYEVISDEEMFVYGWCFSVNGIQPDKLMNQIFIKDEDHVEWLFGYAHYKAGQWLTYCTPSHERQWEKICPTNP